MNLHVNNKDHIQGLASASIELIEYGDFQCPYCKKAHFIIKELQEKFGENLRFVFRHFPLTDLHPNALHAAIASEVAAGDGKFWEMHNLLFENQKTLDDFSLFEFAKKAGLDINRFKKEFDKDRYYQKVKDDYDSGKENAVEGTPTFFINGDIFEGNWMTTEFIEHLESFVK